MVSENKRAPSYLELTNYLYAIINRDGYSSQYDKLIKLLLTTHPSLLDITTFAKVLSLVIKRSAFNKQVESEVYISIILLDILEDIEDNKTPSKHLVINNTPTNNGLYQAVNKVAVLLDKQFSLIKKHSFIQSLFLVSCFALFVYFILSASLLLTIIESLILLVIDYILSYRRSIKKYTSLRLNQSRVNVHPLILDYINFYTQ